MDEPAEILTYSTITATPKSEFFRVIRFWWVGNFTAGGVWVVAAFAYFFSLKNPYAVFPSVLEAALTPLANEVAISFVSTLLLSGCIWLRSRGKSVHFAGRLAAAMMGFVYGLGIPLLFKYMPQNEAGFWMAIGLMAWIWLLPIASGFWLCRRKAAA